MFKKSLIILICLLFITACNQNDKSSETKSYIAQVEKESQPNEQPETIDFSYFGQPAEIDIASLKKRNPFDSLAVQTTAEGSQSKGAGQSVANMKLVGIVDINKKKWAIIRASGKIYRVVSGDKIGAVQTVRKITNDSVVITMDDGEQQQTFTLVLQPNANNKEDKK